MVGPSTEFRLERLDSVALVTMDDGSGESRPNVLGRAALESLADLLPELEQGDFAALVLTGKPGSFAAGADLDEFPLIETKEQAIEGSRAGHELFGRLRAYFADDEILDLTLCCAVFLGLGRTLEVLGITDSCPLDI